MRENVRLGFLLSSCFLGFFACSRVLCEHANNRKNFTTAENLAAHHDACSCKANLKHVTIPGRHRNRFAREVLEALAIEKKEDECISSLSVSLSKRENVPVRRQHF
uniref:Putative tick transposon n=1 Tax=Ixodes ricinus TaxID=34613 RepID=A0A6B0U8T0_IXORI